MNLLQHVAHQWLTWVVQASWQMALLICIVALICVAARGTSSRVRYGLWLLVLAKVFLPPSLTTPWSVGSWGITPLLGMTRLSQTIGPMPRFSDASNDPNIDANSTEPRFGASIAEHLSSPPTLLMTVWMAGCLFFLGAIGWRYVRLVQAMRSASAIDEGPIRVALERIALDLEIRRVPDLFSTQFVTSPCLFGVLRPRIVLPERSLERMSEVELRAVLSHELVHWKHHDTWIGWIQVLGQCIFWFHPLVWWANRQLRHQRECVCDETVLRLGTITPEHYGETIVQVLTASRGRSLVAGSLVGVLERGSKLEERLEEIMNYHPTQRKFGWPSRVGLAAFAVLFLPMAPGALETGIAPAAIAADTPYPQIIKTIPERGATDVDPNLKEIAVTFDRDMDKGMSWTGGPPLFPPIDETRKPRWTDLRTCVLPVKLKKGAYYRLGINSTGFQNFRAADNVAAPPSTICFATQGSSEAIQGRVRAPEIEKIEPMNGAMDVDPKTDALRVTFNMPMEEGMSWTGGGEKFPKLAPGKKAAWSNNGRTCTLPVVLEAEHDYVLGLNSLNHINFQSKWGVPLAPVTYKFRTSAGK